MQLGSQRIRSKLWMTIAGVTILGVGVTKPSTPQALSENGPVATTVARTGENICHNVHRAGRSIGQAVLPKQTVSLGYKGQVGTRGARAIKPWMVGQSAYLFGELAATPTLQAYAPLNLKGKVIPTTAQVPGLRLGFAGGFRACLSQKSFLGLHFSADALPVLSERYLLSIHDVKESVRVGLHGEVGFKKALMQVGLQRTLKTLAPERLKMLFKADKTLTVGEQAAMPKSFAPAYLRVTGPLWKLGKFAVEAGCVEQWHSVGRAAYYGQALLNVKLAVLPMMKKLSKILNIQIGAKATRLGKDASKVGAGLGSFGGFAFNPVCLIELAGGSAKSAESMASTSAMDYYYQVGLPTRNLTGLDLSRGLCDIISKEMLQEIKQGVQGLLDMSKVKGAGAQTPSAPSTAQ